MKFWNSQHLIHDIQVMTSLNINADGFKYLLIYEMAVMWQNTWEYFYIKSFLQIPVILENGLSIEKYL